MPELPEVETIRQGMIPLILGEKFDHIEVRAKALRQPIDEQNMLHLLGQSVLAVERRGKYLLLLVERGYLLIHLGMSGSVLILPQATLPHRHDHVDFIFSSGRVLRYHDPRRFGLLLYGEGNYDEQPQLRLLGVEPLAEQFCATHLFARCQKKTIAIKSLLLDGRVVAGIGNIYASESLFRAQLHPMIKAHLLGMDDFERLVAAIKETLQLAIAAGGSSMRNFTDQQGRPGYFQLQWLVYGRAGELCRHCQAIIEQWRLAGRSTFFCPQCQKER